MKSTEINSLSRVVLALGAE